MSNLEIIKDYYQAFRAKDYPKFIALSLPELEWIQTEGFPGGAIWRGPEAVIAGVFQGNDGRWEGFAFDIEEFLDAGASVAVIGTYRGWHRVSGKSFSAATVHIFDLIEGKVRRFRQFTDTKVICEALPDIAPLD